MAVLKNKGLTKFYAYIIIYINANRRVSRVADKTPGTERCALRLWHPDFDNDNFGQIPMGGDELRENSIISLRIRADEALRISVVCKLQKTELRRGAFVVWGCAKGGGRREVPIENRVFNTGSSRAAGLSVIGGFHCRAEPG